MFPHFSVAEYILDWKERCREEHRLAVSLSLSLTLLMICFFEELMGILMLAPDLFNEETQCMVVQFSWSKINNQAFGDQLDVAV